MCLCPLGEQVWKQAGHRGTVWRSQPRWAQASLSSVAIPFQLDVAHPKSSAVRKWMRSSWKNGITLFRMTFLPFCLLPFTTWEGASSEVYYRSIYLWLLDKVMGLTVPKPRKNTTCKMWGREFSKNCRPGPEAAVTAPLTGNVQGFLAMKQGIQFLLVKFQLQTWKSSYTKLLMNQNWRKESHELLPVETSDFSLALPLICC